MTELPRQNYGGLEDGLILRTARKRWTCQGSGGRPNRHGPNCPSVIEPGEQYVECMWEAAAYQSGTRHAVVCARETHGWPCPWEAAHHAAAAALEHIELAAAGAPPAWATEAQHA